MGQFYDSSEHNPEGPDVKRVVVVLVVNQQLRPLEIATGHPHVVFLAWKVEFSQPPVDNPELLALVVDHDVLRFDVPMHDSVGVAVVQALSYHAITLRISIM